MDKLLNAIITKMKNQGYVSDDNYENVRYGFELVVMRIIICIIILFVGILTHSIIQVFAFMLAYQPLRSYCGGYHAQKRITCITSSVLMLAAIIFISKAVPIKCVAVLSVIIMLVGSVVIVIFSPIGTPNKILDGEETKVYRKRSLIILAIIWLCVLCIYRLRLSALLLPISLAVLSTAALLIIGKLKIK